MKTIKLVFVCLFALTASAAYSQSGLVKNLKKGEDQTLVVYGTSTTRQGSGPLWVAEIDTKLNDKYKGHLTVLNKGGSGRNSQWATQNLADSVLTYKPNTVIIEFSINDAVERFDIEPAQAKKNTQWMIKKLQEQGAEVILLVVATNPLREAATKRPNLAEYIQVYRELAQENKLQLIDFTPVWQKVLDEKGEKSFRVYQSDGVHPSKRGALEMVAPNVIKALEKGK